MRIKRPGHSTVVAYLALFMGLGGTAVAATGGPFILGSSNSENSTARLHNTAGGTALHLSSSSSTTAPLSVSNGTKILQLNADRLDGLNSTQLQRRVTGSCPAGKAIRAVGALGAVSCSAIPANWARSAHRGSGPSSVPIGELRTIVTQVVPKGFYVITAKATVITEQSKGSDCMLSYELPGGSEVTVDSSNQSPFNSSVTARTTHNLQRLLQFGTSSATLRLKCRAGAIWFGSDSSIISHQTTHATDSEVTG